MGIEGRVEKELHFFLWTATDPRTGKRRQLNYRMTEATARERFGGDALGAVSPGLLSWIVWVNPKSFEQVSGFWRRAAGRRRVL